MNRIENVRITSAERRTNSASGNPMWTLHTDRGTFTTDADSSVGGVITNFQNPEQPEYAIGDNAPAVTLLTNGRSRVIGIEKKGVVLR